MPDDYKPTLCLDFDGVIHRYSIGWQNGVIYDDITEGFWEWAEQAAKHFKLVIYSSRSKTQGGIDQMMAWLVEERMKWREQNNKPETDNIMSFDFASEKPAAFLTIDDRAITFRGFWSEFDPEKMLQFKPWNASDA